MSTWASPDDRHAVPPARHQQEHSTPPTGNLIAHTISRMEMPRAHPRWGIELDWLGVDQRGHVAVFTTADYGPVPDNVNLDPNEVDGAIEHLHRLPLTSEADQIIKPASDGNYADWYSYSVQGFYAYDWHRQHGPYIRLSVPTVPIAITSLPLTMQAAAGHAAFELDFTQVPQIEVEYREPPTD